MDSHVLALLSHRGEGCAKIPGLLCGLPGGVGKGGSVDGYALGGGTGLGQRFGVVERGRRRRFFAYSLVNQRLVEGQDFIRCCLGRTLHLAKRGGQQQRRFFCLRLCDARKLGQGLYVLLDVCDNVYAVLLGHLSPYPHISGNFAGGCPHGCANLFGEWRAFDKHHIGGAVAHRAHQLEFAVLCKTKGDTGL